LSVEGVDLDRQLQSRVALTITEDTNCTFISLGVSWFMMSMIDFDLNVVGYTHDCMQIRGAFSLYIVVPLRSRIADLFSFAK
jgi:hypothetical protein